METRKEALEYLKTIGGNPVYVHGIDCEVDEARAGRTCTEEEPLCDGFMQVPSREDVEAILSSPLDEKPIQGWGFTARALLEMFGLENSTR